jgi:hypothetical protein
MHRDRAIVVSRDDEKSPWLKAELPAPTPLYGRLADSRVSWIACVRGFQFGHTMEGFLAPNYFFYNNFDIYIN